MKLRIAILFCLFNITFGNAQNSILTPQQMQEDLAYLNKYLRKWHPTYYSYTPKSEMNAFYAGLKDSCANALNERVFRVHVRRVVAKVGCGHMGVLRSTPTKDLKVIPVNFWVLNNRLFIKSRLAKDSLLTVGAEVLAINGEKASDFIEKAKVILVTDGFGDAYKVAQLESNFEVYHYLLYGALPNYDLTIKNTEGGISTVNLAAAFQKEMPNVPKFSRDSSQIVIKGSSANLYKLSFDDKTMVLDINSFNGKKLKKTFKETFKHLKKQGTQNLVIDLRDNGGGNIFKGNYLLTHLLDQAIIPFTISRKPNLTFINPHNKVGFWTKITPFLFATMPLQFPDKHGWNHIFPFFKRNHHHFDGKIYVLTNNKSFSMASYVASYLKHKREAVVIGGETGGSEYASRSSASCEIHLPNSKVKVYFNVYQTQHHVGIKDSGHGVLPDFPTTYSVADKMNNVDLEMQMVEKLIKN
jgi:Peptidase family S41